MLLSCVGFERIEACNELTPDLDKSLVSIEPGWGN